MGRVQWLPIFKSCISFCSFRSERQSAATENVLLMTHSIVYDSCASLHLDVPKIAEVARCRSADDGK